MLDEATLEFGWRYDSIGPAQQALADARHAHMRSYTRERGDYAPEAWDRAADAARDLADAHESFAAVTPTHRGHCCFVPAVQTCHPAEVAEWERQNALRHRAGGQLVREHAP